MKMENQNQANQLAIAEQVQEMEAAGSENISSITSEINSFLDEKQLSQIQNLVPSKSLRWIDGKGNKRYMYIKDVYIMEQLNQVFGYDGWSWDVTSNRIDTDKPIVKDIDKRGQVNFYEVSASVVGTLTIYLSKNNKDREIRRSGIGSHAGQCEDKNANHADLVDMCIKAAETDALKRAAKKIGARFGMMFDGDRQIPLEQAEDESNQTQKITNIQTIKETVTPVAQTLQNNTSKLEKIDEIHKKETNENVKINVENTYSEQLKPVEKVVVKTLTEMEKVIEEITVKPVLNQNIQSASQKESSEISKSTEQKDSSIFLGQSLETQEVIELRQECIEWSALEWQKFLTKTNKRRETITDYNSILEIYPLLHEMNIQIIKLENIQLRNWMQTLSDGYAKMALAYEIDDSKKLFEAFKVLNGRILVK